jgi:uncharacterized protein (TIGR00730 family)
MKRITIFCGSSHGKDKIYMQAAYHVGETLAKKGIGLVYGGANIGLMGAVADGALSAGGEVIGVLPTFLRNIEIQHTGLTELILVETMHQRKTKMDELCDGVIALPGGFGTMEEFFEILTWSQLGLHKKPMALLNVNGFYDHLKAQVQVMVDQGLLKEVNQKMLLMSTEIDDLLEKMSTYNPPIVGKWISKEKI